MARTPQLVVVTAGVLVVLVPVIGVLAVVSAVLSLVAVGPVVFLFAAAMLVNSILFGGIGGIAAAALDERASLSDTTDTLRDGRGLSLAGATALELIVLAVVGLAVALLWLVVRSGLRPFGIAAVALVTDAATLLGAVLAVTIVFALQFVDVAAVLDDASANEALIRSYRLSLARPVEVAGYTVLRVGLVGVTLLPGVVLVVAAEDLTGPLGGVGTVGLLATVLLLPVGLAAAITTHVAYYRRRTGHA